MWLVGAEGLGPVPPARICAVAPDQAHQIRVRWGRQRLLRFGAAEPKLASRAAVTSEAPEGARGVGPGGRRGDVALWRNSIHRSVYMGTEVWLVGMSVLEFTA